MITLGDQLIDGLCGKKENQDEDFKKVNDHTINEGVDDNEGAK